MDLRLDARLNIQTDSDVTTFRHSLLTHLKPTEAVPIFPTTKAILLINDTHITANIQQWIRDHLTSSNMARYIMKKTGLTMLQMKQIDWVNLGTALEHQQTHTKIRLIRRRLCLAPFVVLTRRFGSTCSTAHMMTPLQSEP
eukprot:7446115-Ditylum_brightwellii.AAC.1